MCPAQGPADEVPVLVVPESAEGAEAIQIAEAVHLARAPRASVDTGCPATCVYTLGNVQYLSIRRASSPRRSLALTCVVAAIDIHEQGRDLINTPASDLGPAELEARSHSIFLQSHSS